MHSGVLYNISSYDGIMGACGQLTTYSRLFSIPEQVIGYNHPPGRAVGDPIPALIELAVRNINILFSVSYRDAGR